MPDDFSDLTQEQREQLGRKLGGAITSIIEVLGKLDGLTYEEAMDTFCWDWIINRAFEANEKEET